MVVTCLWRMLMSKMRVGTGYDVHRLVEGRKLVLGGIEIPFEKGLLGHSDADVLTHAIMDALCGALCLGDIGKLYPDTDPKYKDISSLRLLRGIMDRVEDRGYTIGNVDVVVMAQRPKLAPHIDAMRKKLAEVMDCRVDQVSVKATTTEGLGFVGREEGMAAMASLLLFSKDEEN